MNLWLLFFLSDVRPCMCHLREEDTLQYAWDTNEAILKPKDLATWTMIDGKIDTVLRELRAVHPNPVTEKTALQSLLLILK